MGRMIGFGPWDDDFGGYESRRGRSSRTGRYTRSEYEGEYEGRGRGGWRSRHDDYHNEYGPIPNYQTDLARRSERENRRRGMDEDMEERGRMEYRRGGRSPRSDYDREERGGRRGYDDRDGYD